MPFTVEYAPAPLNFNIRRGLNWKMLLSIPVELFILYWLFVDSMEHPKRLASDIVILALSFAATILGFIRRENIQIYSDRIVWRRTYFGFPYERSAPLSDVVGADWMEGKQHGEDKSPDYVEFFLPDTSIRACYGFTFEEFDSMREHIRTMFPDLIKRWGSSSVRSRELTLLNLH